jgi:hypothetical protein
VLADDVIAGPLGVEDRGHHFVRRLAVVERRDQRLYDAHRPIVGANVAPGFQEVGFRDVPVTLGRRLVFVEAHVRLHADLVERFGELQVDRRAVDRVGADDQQELDRPGVHLAHKLAQRRALIDGLNLGRIRERHGRSRVSEREIDRVRQRVDDRRLAVAGNDQTAAARRVEILHQRFEPA